jgi:hypothetical protein
MLNESERYRVTANGLEVVPKIAMLKELEEGLQLHGLLGEIRKHPAAFKPIFTASTSFDMTADDFFQRLVVHFSKQQLLRSKEQDVFKYFKHFIQALYYKGKIILSLFIQVTSASIKH